MSLVYDETIFNNKSPERVFINDRGHACLYWYEILHYDGNVSSFQTDHNIRRSYLPASFGTAARRTT